VEIFWENDEPAPRWYSGHVQSVAGPATVRWKQGRGHRIQYDDGTRHWELLDEATWRLEASAAPEAPGPPDAADVIADDSPADHPSTRRSTRVTRHEVKRDVVEATPSAAPDTEASWRARVVMGDRVAVHINGDAVHGTVMFMDKTHFQVGEWVGVALDSQVGQHDGTIDGIRYFRAAEGHGVFVRREQLLRLPAEASSRSLVKVEVS